MPGGFTSILVRGTSQNSQKVLKIIKKHILRGWNVCFFFRLITLNNAIRVCTYYILSQWFYIQIAELDPS